MSSPHPQPASLARRSLDAVWHPCTQMARAEHLPPLAITKPESDDWQINRQLAHEILASLGYAPQEIAALREKGAV
mgnify:CR=1 FL=1